MPSSTFSKYCEIYREVSSTPLLLTRSTNDPVLGMANVRVRDSCIMLAVASTVFMQGQDLDSTQLGAVWTLELPHYQLSTHPGTIAVETGEIRICFDKKKK